MSGWQKRKCKDKFGRQIWERVHWGPNLFSVEIYVGFIYWIFVLCSTSFFCVDSFPKDNWLYFLDFKFLKVISPTVKFAPWRYLLFKYLLQKLGTIVIEGILRSQSSSSSIWLISVCCQLSKGYLWNLIRYFQGFTKYVCLKCSHHCNPLNLLDYIIAEDHLFSLLKINYLHCSGLQGENERAMERQQGR